MIQQISFSNETFHAKLAEMKKAGGQHMSDFESKMATSALQIADLKVKPPTKIAY